MSTFPLSDGKAVTDTAGNPADGSERDATADSTTTGDPKHYHELMIRFGPVEALHR